MIPSFVRPRHAMAFVAVCMFLVLASERGDGQHARYVDPFLGASGDGNVFPGPAVPFGMIKPGPDMIPSGENDPNAGWNDFGEIRGFSQTHVSGTGGGPKYGNIELMPTTGPVTHENVRSPRSQEIAQAGYYGVHLTRYDIGVEITASARAALYRFTFPEGRASNLLFDVGRCLVASPRHGESQAVTESQIQVVSPSEVAGFSSVTGGWNKQTNSYTVYFDAVASLPSQAHGTWMDARAGSSPDFSSGGRGSSVGAWLTFSSRDPIYVRIGISFVSIEQARLNLQDEIPTFSFDTVRARASQTWERALSSVDVKGASTDLQTQFYTALYHAMLMPTDRTGENPLWRSSEPYYDDFYAIWDIFRTSGPLLTLIAPQRQAAMVRSLIDIYRHEGWLPDARSGNFNGRTQGGSDAEFLITDAYVKHLPGIDWSAALEAEIHDAEAAPLDHFKEGRGGLDDWHRRGYVSIEGSDRSGSINMEYAADDFEIALLAHGLGNLDASSKYLARSGNWKNVWDQQFTDGGFTGFVRPRHRDGSWLSPFSAMDSCSWNGNTFYEGNSWTYSFFVPQDIPGLIQAMGGPQTFLRRLDAFFAVPGRYDVGNEPGFLVPYLYHWAGRPDRSSEQVRRIVAASFHAGKAGLPGNDDSGAMSSWFAFAEMGLFPVAGQDLYLIVSPAFSQIMLHTGSGSTFSIEARNLSATNRFIASATLNGRPLQRAWLRHREIVAGGHLVLTMAAKPGAWGSTSPPPAALDQ